MNESSRPLILHSSPTRWGMTHCACAVDGLATPAQARLSSALLWQQPIELVRLPLWHDHIVAYNPIGNGGAVVLNRPAQTIWEKYVTPRGLEDETAEKLERLDLLQPVGEGAADPRFSSSHTLTAWLHITNACNLRCAYCFVHKSNEIMDEATGKAAVSAVFASAQRHAFHAVKLKYAGGEPTLQFDLLRLLHAHAQRLSQDQALPLEEVVISNGVALTAKILDFMRDANMILSISLDGLDAATHDSQRAFANGRGSVDHVIRGIDRALSHGVKPHLSMTVTRHNVDALPDVVRFALERQLFFNLNFYQEHEPGLSHKELQPENQQLIAGLRRALAIIEADLPSYNVFTALLDRTNLAGPHAQACGVGKNYLVIDHRGSVARCQMEIDRPVTHISAGDVLQTIRLFDRQDQFANLSVTEKTECSTCTWRYWCAGGCSLMTYRARGRDDVRSPYCDVYRAVLPEILRLEGLRLLRWGTVSC